MSALKRAKPVKKAAKSTAKSTTIAKVPQPHGGALNAGGTVGNAGGTGRPPSVVRAASRQAYDERIPILATIADDKNAEAKDRIAAIKALGAFGLSGAVSADDVRERLLATLTEIRAYLPMEQAEQLIARIRAHWMTTA